MRQATFRRLTRACAATLAGVVVAALLPSAPGWSAPADRSPPTTPTNLRVTGTTETTISLAWNASTDNRGPVRYVVDVVESHIDHGPYSTTSGTVGNGLIDPNRTYTLRVRAYDGAFNYSGFSSAVTATTRPDLTAPTTPSTVQVVRATPHILALGIGRASDNATEPYTLVYRIRDGATLIGQIGSSGNPPSLIPFERRHLPRGKVLDLKVSAVDESGNESAPVTLTVDLPDSADTTPPSAPTLTSATDAEYGQARLAWSAAADNVSAATAIEYEFVIDGVHVLANGAHQATPVAPAGRTNWWVSVFNPPGTFTFQVVAVDEAGNLSAPSNPLATPVTIGY